MIKSAVISDCKKYRYSLTRIWDKSKNRCLFILFNPSTADDNDNDRTVNRCIEFASDLGFGGFEIVNLFAFRTAYPNELYEIRDPVGSQNLEYIVKAIKSGDKCIAGWGNNGSYLNQDKKILTILRKKKIKLYCLKITSEQQPGHPGRLSQGLKLTQFNY